MTMIIIVGNLSCGYARNRRTARKQRHRITPPPNAICFDGQAHAIYKNESSEVEKCVFTSSFEENRLSTVGMDSIAAPPNPECRLKNVCFAACQKSNCVAFSAASTVIRHKATWTLRFVCFASLYTGCVLGYMLFLSLTRIHRIEALVYKKQIEASYESSDLVSESEDIVQCLGENASQNSLDERSMNKIKSHRSRMSLNGDDIENEVRHMSLF